MVEGKQTIDHTSLQHGLFQFTFPHTWKGTIAWVIAAILFLVAGAYLLASFDIPDVPPIADSQYVDSLDDIDDEEETKKICSEIITKVGAQTIKDMGKVMGELKKNYSDSIDFSKAGSTLKELLNK